MINNKAVILIANLTVRLQDRIFRATDKDTEIRVVKTDRAIVMILNRIEEIIEMMFVTIGTIMEGAVIISKIITIIMVVIDITDIMVIPGLRHLPQEQYL